VRVTNLDNNRSVILRVNDRGPFYSDRIIDLSYAAAKKLGYAEIGTARVGRGHRPAAMVGPAWPTGAADAQRAASGAE
jgi:rare lipoprotein A (peptidoglycan hydrolase)